MCFETGFPTWLTDSLGRAVSELWESVCLCFPSMGHRRVPPHLAFYMWILRTDLRSSSLHRKCFTMKTLY